MLDRIPCDELIERAAYYKIKEEEIKKAQKEAERKAKSGNKGRYSF